MRDDHPQKGKPLFPFPLWQFQYKYPVQCQFFLTVSISLDLSVVQSYETESSFLQYFLQARRIRQFMGIQTAPLQQLSRVPYQESDIDRDLMPSYERSWSGSIIIYTTFCRIWIILSFIYFGNSFCLKEFSELLYSGVNISFFCISSILTEISLSLLSISNQFIFYNSEGSAIC